MQHTALTTMTTVMATIGDGAELKDIILLIAGNVFIAVLAVRAVGYYAKREWGELIGHMIGAVVVAGLVYMPDQSINILKDLWRLVFGN